ncbi:MAG: hypothetical protein FWD69_19355 [Polyangiaceae bacterium]|nr:hypothetical protein [Polyangiaceae bacterium]
MTNASRRVLHAALFVVGVLLVGWLVEQAGIDRVKAILAEAGGWLPLIVILELGIVANDVLATRWLLGGAASAVRKMTWTRSTALAYAMTALLPAGRAAGEAARAAALSRDVGWATAATATSTLQAAVLFGNAVASASAALASANVNRMLALLLGLNAALCGGLGVLVLTLSRWSRLARWLRARVAVPGAPAAPIERGAVARAALLCVVGRVIQAIQYGVALHAVGGSAGVRSALVTQGIHLIGATVGDAVPNQIGATDGAYRLFADALGLADAPARSLSIALLVRIAQLGLAAIAVAIATVVSRQSRQELAERATSVERQ